MLGSEGHHVDVLLGLEVLGSNEFGLELSDLRGKDATISEDSGKFGIGDLNVDGLEVVDKSFLGRNVPSDLLSLALKVGGDPDDHSLLVSHSALGVIVD